MPELTIDDYRWLVSEQSLPYLDDAASSDQSFVALAKRLRAALSPERTHLVLEQVELRERARMKFSRPEKMFFTRKLLEQSTDEQIAGYKASRFPKDRPIADLCCGVGGDSLALARRGPCLAVDRDPVAALLVDANCRSLAAGELSSEVADVRLVVERLNCQAWHIDPDRRATARRTSQVMYCEPGLDVMHALLRRVDAGAIKLAPGAQLATTVSRMLWLNSSGSEAGASVASKLCGWRTWLVTRGRERRQSWIGKGKAIRSLAMRS